MSNFSIRINKIRESKQFIESVAKGLSESEQGEVFTTSRVKSLLKENRSK